MVRGVIGETVKNNAVSIGEELENRILELRDFLYERVYESEMVHEDFKKCARIVEDLYTYFLNNPEAFLEETGRTVFYDEPSVCVCDYIAGMTDRYAFTLFEKLFLPMPWKIPV
jgi:dGTPase